MPKVTYGRKDIVLNQVNLQLCLQLCAKQTQPIRNIDDDLTRFDVSCSHNPTIAWIEVGYLQLFDSCPVFFAKFKQCGVARSLFCWDCFILVEAWFDFCLQFQQLFVSRVCFKAFSDCSERLGEVINLSGRVKERLGFSQVWLCKDQNINWSLHL